MTSTANNLAGQKRWSLNVGGKILPLVIVFWLLSNIYFIGYLSFMGEAPERSITPMLPVTKDNAGDAPTFIRQAIAWCKTADLSHSKNKTLLTRLVDKRILRWKKLKEKKENELINFYNVLNHKLGAYLYAAKAGVESPRILFCGKAEDLPPDMSSSFGRKYVVKPLSGYSSKGVNLVVDGVDKFSGKNFSRDTLVEDYGSEGETIVEELIESAHPHFEGDVPPDYKFHVYEGRPEVLWVIDRNKDHHGMKCNNNFDISSDDWRPLEMDSAYPWCPPDEDGKVNEHYLDSSRKANMMKAVRALAGKLGKDWMRIDMFDSSRGPVIGEFTPYSGRGKSRDPVDSCIMSHLIVAHAEHGGPTDDIETLHAVGDKMGADLGFLAEGRSPFSWNQLGLTLEEVRQWKQSSELERCKATMKAQE